MDAYKRMDVVKDIGETINACEIGIAYRKLLDKYGEIVNMDNFNRAINARINYILFETFSEWLEDNGLTQK